MSTGLFILSIQAEPLNKKDTSAGAMLDELTLEDFPARTAPPGEWAMPADDPIRVTITSMKNESTDYE
jgi:hypothetical protein